MLEEYENQGTEPEERPQDREWVPAEFQKPKKGWTGGKIVALALCCALLGGGMGVGGSFLGYSYLTNRQQTEVPAQKGPTTVLEGNREGTVLEVSKIDTSKEMTAAEVYARNVNSTVGITTSVTTNFWGYQTTSAASGSGFLITADGYVLTNFHVIENSDSITVSLYDGTSMEAALIGYDEKNDLAVLKIDAQGLTPVVLGNSDQLNVGDSVIAIGNPLGELTFSLTSGAVSALDREITLSNNVTMDLIQTDCAINSGNSGGALFNLYGEVVGITNAKYSGSSGSGASIDNIGFAIPINSIKEIVTSIIEKGYIQKPYIGVYASDVNAEAQRYGLPAGAAIVSVEEDGPAQEAGLQANDIITAVNGEEISGSRELSALVGDADPGEEWKLTVYRQGQTLELTLTVGEQTKSALPNAQAHTESGQYPGFPEGGFGR